MNKSRTHRLILKSFSKRKKEDSSLTLRKLAEQSKISPGYLSKIFSGKMPLNKKIIEQLARCLKMDELQYFQIMECFEQTVLKDKVGKVKKSEGRTFSADEYELLPSQSEWILSKWYYVCVLDLITTRDFTEDPQWIARRLSIRHEDAAEALTSLARAKLTFRDDKGQLNKTYRKLRFPTKISKELIRNFHIAQMKRAINLISHPSNQIDFDKRLITSLTIATNPEKIQEVKKILHQALYQAADILSEGESLELYQLNLQFFPQSR